VTDWFAWHQGYDDPSSAISARLARIWSHLEVALDRAPAGSISVLSLCAGQGHDVIGALAGHPRCDDARAVLVELDPRNAQRARESAAAAGLAQVEVRQSDASRVATFADTLPADVLLLCGIFGNISATDIERVIGAAPALCADGATVIWTRHRRAPDLTPRIRAWFAASGFAAVAFDSLANEQLTAVGVHRLSRRAGGTAARPGESDEATARPDEPDRTAARLDEPLFAFRADAV
jgi:hypothetical protein